MAHHALTKAAQTLIGICSGLTADGTLNDAEIIFLRTWLSENIEVATIWPGSAIADRITQIMEDGKISDDERTSLLDLLKSLSGNEFSETGSVAPAGPAAPFDDTTAIDFPGKSFCLTGTFFFGTRAACERVIQQLGATAADNVTGKLDYLVVGSGCNADWANTTYGRKIETALERKQRYGKPLIVSEANWVGAIKKISA